jgi:RNA polymerase sigma-70 factor (ECF subfamily)
MANSVLIDHLRAEAVSRKYQERLQKAENEGYPASGYSDNDFEMADYINAVSQSLSPVRKNIFLLKIVKGYSNKEIANQLSISIKTVEDHYTKAIRQVRSMVSLSVVIAFFLL